MIADIHDMRRGFIPADNRGRSQEVGRRKSLASFRKVSSNFIQRLGATVTETFSEWRRWVWPAIGSAMALQSSVREETEKHVPQVERSDAEGNIVVRLRLPGLRREKIRVEVFDRTLLLSGECREWADDGKPQVETFYRSLTLPEGITVEDIRMEFGDGVLMISMRLPGRKSNGPIRAMVI